MRKKSIVSLVVAAFMVFTIIPSTVFAEGTPLTTDFTDSKVLYVNQTVSRTPLTVTVGDGTAPYTYKWYGVPTKSYYRDSSTLLATHIDKPNVDSFTPLSNAGTMYYYVEVTDALGNTSQIYTRDTLSPYARVDVIPNPPTNIKVTNLNSFQNYLSWTGVKGSGVEYQVYRSCKYYSLKTCGLGTTGTNYKDSCGGMVPGVLYYYKIKSRVVFDGQTNDTYSTYSSAVSVAYKLPAPKITSLSKVSSTSIRIYWSKVSAATGYKLYQKVSGGEWKCIKTITTNATLSYKKTGLVSGKTYYYKIRAYKTYDGHTGYSAYSPVISKKL